MALSVVLFGGGSGITVGYSVLFLDVYSEKVLQKSFLIISIKSREPRRINN